MNMEPAENEETRMQDVFAKSGISGLNAYAKEKLEEWKNTPVKLAVVGNSGVGKSSFINKIRNMTPKNSRNHPQYAKVGSGVVGTMEPTEYEFPDNSQIKIWDIPGAGTTDVSIKTYHEQMEFSKFDAFIILSAERFTENDAKIAEEIKKMGKPFYFGKTKMDLVMKSDQEENGDDFSEAQTREKIIVDSRKNLGDGYEEEKIYLLSKTNKDTYTTDDEETFTFEFPDNENIKVGLVEDLPDKAKAALVLTLSAKSTQLLSEKVKELKKRIWWSACLSGAVAAAPVPGLSLAVDLQIIAKEALFQIKQLGIDGDTMKERAKMLGITTNQFVVKIKSIAREGASNSLFAELILTLVDFLQHEDLFKMNSTRMLLTALLQSATFLAVLVAEEATESALKFVPIIGSIAGAILSSGTTITILSILLKGNETLAKACLVISD